MIWLLMTLMCLYGFFGNDRLLPVQWRDHPAVAVVVAIIAGIGIGTNLHGSPVAAACWAFSCLMLYIGATRYDPHH